MEEFERPLEHWRIESTNTMWNSLHLNSKWSIGCTSDLIQLKNWKSKEEWEEFYFNSGRERRQIIGPHHDVMDNFKLTWSQASKQDAEYQQMNYSHGRTPEDLMERARALYDAVKDYKSQLTLDECFECVKYRTIGQTWNGIVLAETTCISILSRRFPRFDYRKVSGKVDYDYEVDYEVFSYGNPIVGIQIKPTSYFGDAPYLISARQINAMKFAAYKRDTGRDVLIVKYEKPKGGTLGIVNLSEIEPYLNSL